MENNQNNGMVSAFGASMPAEYEQATADVISELNINIAAPVLFQYAYNLLSNYGKNYLGSKTPTSNDDVIYLLNAFVKNETK